MRNYEINPILLTDSYKVAHWAVYPEGTTEVYSYLESRGGLFAETVFFGLQYFLKKYLTIPVTMEMIDEAEKRFQKHFGSATIFNRAGWEHIVNTHGGKLPLEIKAPFEGTVIPTRNVLMTIVNTDPKCYWLTNYMETMLLKVWYPITVATLSREIKKVILEALDRTGDPSGLPFKLHDFGYRGASSEESARLGGAAHLVNFMGTDTFGALELCDEFYHEEMAGFSIPATEHSIMTALGEMGESRMMERFLDIFGQNENVPAIACVSDQYNIFNACENIWGGELKGKVLNMKNMLVVRPDSGELPTTVIQVVETLDRAFGHSENNKGFKILNNVRVIQGDGVELATIKQILDALIARGWSADNIAFGMGGALLQKVNRDTQQFAIKASSMVINGSQKDIFKSPITGSTKRSKAGKLKLVKDEDGYFTTVRTTDIGHDCLHTVYKNGSVTMEQTLAEIRENAKL
jgi:nicotinamide phosphoribosyltransferase